MSKIPGLVVGGDVCDGVAAVTAVVIVIIVFAVVKAGLAGVVVLGWCGRSWILWPFLVSAVATIVSAAAAVDVV